MANRFSQIKTSNVFLKINFCKIHILICLSKTKNLKTEKHLFIFLYSQVLHFLSQLFNCTPPMPTIFSIINHSWHSTVVWPPKIDLWHHLQQPMEQIRLTRYILASEIDVTKSRKWVEWYKMFIYKIKNIKYKCIKMV